jgi:peptidoglycan hydrolase-like protein with peptidoglycan-binding domain
MNLRKKIIASAATLLLSCGLAMGSAPVAEAAPAPTPLNQCGTVWAYSYNYSGCVVTIQQTLQRLGYNPGAIDGIYGPQTTNAVMAYQSDSWIDVDGSVGPQTRASMTAEIYYWDHVR